MTTRVGRGARIIIGTLVLGATMLVVPGPAGAETIDWIEQFGVADLDHVVSGTAVDAGGGAHQVGTVNGPWPADHQVFVRRYDPAGALLWAREFGGPDFDSAADVAVDGAGNSYVAGFTWNDLSGEPFTGFLFLSKFDGSGALVWTRQFGTDLPTRDAAFGVAVDAGGSSYLVGHAGGRFPGHSTSAGQDAFVRKFAPDGADVWTRQFGTGATEEAYGVTVDALGNIHVSGATGGSLPGATSASSGGYDAFVRTFDASGVVLWTAQFGTAASDFADDVAVDGTGNVYVGGYTAGTFPGAAAFGGGIYDIFLVKYDPTGAIAWSRQSGDASLEVATSVAVDQSGNAYLAGRTNGTLPGGTSAGSDDGFVRRYESSGDLAWTRHVGTDGSDTVTGVATDAAGNVYVGGSTTGAFTGETSETGIDGFLARISQAPPAPPAPPLDLSVTAIIHGPIRSVASGGAHDVSVAKVCNEGPDIVTVAPADVASSAVVNGQAGNGTFIPLTNATVDLGPGACKRYRIDYVYGADGEPSHPGDIVVFTHAVNRPGDTNPADNASSTAPQDAT